MEQDFDPRRAGGGSAADEMDWDGAVETTWGGSDGGGFQGSGIYSGAEGTSRRVDLEEWLAVTRQQQKTGGGGAESLAGALSQGGFLLLVLGLCQARPQRDDDDRHLLGH